MKNIKKWKNELSKDLYECWENHNTDHPDCPRCNGVMNFFGHDDNGDFPYGEGYWECPSCGFSIKESELD